MMSVRVRFAPSPTGFLHVGGGRTVIYNYLFARHNGGTLVLRSDDTDEARSTAEYAADIVESLQWLGLDWDEGIGVGGPFAPYRQSERTERYRQVAYELVVAGSAYYSFETPEQLDVFRRDAHAAGTSPAYDGRFRIPTEAAAQRIEAGEAAPIRFSVPRPGESRFIDAVKGEMTFDHAQVDDFVILRSDGSPTYHLASTVDDCDFQITHVVRGEDLLPSTPKHIMLTEAMGRVPPVYAHLSLLMGPDGSKLSKRHGHTALRAYREAGYLPEAVRNYLAILGWSPGPDEEIVPFEEMIGRFDLGNVSTNPAVFDVTKLEWMNGVYIRALAVEELVERVRPLVEADLQRPLNAVELDTLTSIVPLVQERAKTLDEVAPQVRFLFVGAPEYDEASWQKVMTAPEVGLALTEAVDRLAALDEWTDSAIEGALRGIVADHGIGARKAFQPVRVAVTGSAVSPPLFESIRLLGREPTLARLDAARSRL
jgi:glutamyl-tRNA synthetase